MEGPAGDELYLEGKFEGMGHTTKAGASIRIAADGKSASYSVKVEQDGAVSRTQSGVLTVPSQRDASTEQAQSPGNP